MRLSALLRSAGCRLARSSCCSVHLSSGLNEAVLSNHDLGCMTTWGMSVCHLTCKPPIAGIFTEAAMPAPTERAGSLGSAVSSSSSSNSNSSNSGSKCLSPATGNTHASRGLGRSAQSLFQQQQWQQQFLSPLVVVPVKQQQGVSRTYCTSSGDPPPAEPCSPAADAEEAEASAEVSASQLTHLIQEAASLADLQDLLQQPAHSHLGHNTRVVASLQWLRRHPEEQPGPPEQLAALVQQLMKEVAVDELTAQECVGLAYYCSKLGYVEDLDLYRALLQRLSAVMADASPVDIQNLLYALRSREQLQVVLQQPQLLELLQQLRQTVEGQPPSPDTPLRLSSALLSASKMGQFDNTQLVEVMGQLLGEFVSNLSAATPRAVSYVLYAFGGSKPQLRGLVEPGVVVALLEQLEEAGDTATPPQLSITLWAAAWMAPGDSPQLGQVVAQLLNRLTHRLEDANPEDVAKTLHALAQLPRAWPMDSALQLVERLVQLLPQAKPWHASDVVWALGAYVQQGWLAPVGQQRCAQLQSAVSKLTAALASGSQQVNPNRVSSSLWALAMLQAQLDWGLVGQLLGRVIEGEPNARSLANGCWAVAKLQELHVAPSGRQKRWKQAFKEAARRFAPLMHQAPPKLVALVLSACAGVRHYPRQLLQALTMSPAPLPTVQQAKPKEVAALAAPLAVLAPDSCPAALMASLLQRMQDLLARQPAAVNSQDLADTAWAVAVLDQQQLAGELAPLAEAAFSQQRWDSSQAENLARWHWVHLWLTDTQVLGPAGLGAFPGVTQQQLEECRAAWNGRQAANTQSTPHQLMVAKVLASMAGVEVLGPNDQHDRSHDIHIAVRYKGQLLAVQLDKPRHFTWPGQRPTGTAVARNKALERRGYKVVCVPVYRDWHPRHLLQDQRKYLQGLLDAAIAVNGTLDSSSHSSSSSRSSSSSSSRVPFAAQPAVASRSVWRKVLTEN